MDGSTDLVNYKAKTCIKVSVVEFDDACAEGWIKER